ncbi:class I SAM-dependent methyltransferase [Clostridium thailandense]|uniref:class I SAM-dependent methyltransferase n=1 Tax=Clostridium thailandense TaxID=2794346 RepID=UPI0039893C0B
MELKEKINDYWSKRADEFGECRLKDLEGFQRKIWTDIISELVPSGKGLRALDIGTGAGFYAFLLYDLGFEVTAVDYSQNMIDNAIKNSEKLGYKHIKFIKMDAQDLKFQDESFDLIISRNVTWTLPDPKKAYEEWCRVLVLGGKIMNFDANYGQGFKLAEETGQSYKEMQNWSQSTYNRTLQSEELISQRNDFAKQLYICDIIRPQWDVDILLQNGISKIIIDTEISSRVYVDMQGREVEANNSNNGKRKFGSDSNMFMVYGIKGRWQD